MSADRLAEIQARAANGIAGSVDVDWLIREVLALRSEVAATTDQLQRLDGELVRLRDEKLRDAQALAASLTERLAALQDGNEGAYRELYDERRGPHFCPDRPIGQAAASEQVTA